MKKDRRKHSLGFVEILFYHREASSEEYVWPITWQVLTAEPKHLTHMNI